MSNARIAGVTAIALLAGFGGCHNRPEDVTRLTVNGEEVRHIDVVEVPRYISAYKDYPPESLERSYIVRVELRAEAEALYSRELKEAVAARRCVKSAGATDLRTAVLFIGANGKRLKSVYYGAEPKTGLIDQSQCEFTPDLYKWARKLLPPE